MLPFGGLPHLQPARSREQRPDPHPPRSADDSPSPLRPSHAISDQTARTQASGVRDAALSIGSLFSGVSMDYSEDHFQLADTDLSYATDRLRRSTQKPRAVRSLLSQTIPRPVVGMSRLTGQQRPMRHELTSDDEKRLFPSYVKKNGGVPIVPGQTVAVAATKKTKPGQQFSNKPVDRISQNSKQGGPFRARGKKSNTPKALLTAIDDASRTGRAPNFEASDRPAKRQRRNSQPAPSNVYSFSDNDDVMEQIVPISSPPPVPELLSYTSPSRKQTGNRVWEPNEDTIPESVPSDSDHDELFTENAAKERRSSVSDIIASHSKSLNQAPRPGILQSVEIQEPKVAPKMKAISSPSVSNRRRGSSGSSDELQGAVTVPPVPSTLPLRKEDVSSALRSSPSDIRSTTFSPSGSKNKKGRKKRRRVPSEQTHQLEEPYRSFEASQVQFGPVQLRPSSERAVEVNIDTNRLWVVGNTPESSLQQEISLRQIMQVIYGEDTSCKIRLGLSKMEGQCNQMDIELITPEVKDELFHLLQILPIKFKCKPSEWMDRTFKNTEREFSCFSNRLKRPSIDSVSEPVLEPGTETPKRPKISESLQVDDRTIVPSNDTDNHPPKSADVPIKECNESDDTAHAHPTRVSTTNSVEIPMIKYSPPVPPSNRQTRSTTHRADPEPATVICDDDDDDRNDSVPQPPARTFAKWEKPLLYPRFGKKKAEVDAQDRERLRSDEFLNDNLIGFYMRFLEDHLERTNKEAAKRVYFFNSYFYATLTNNPKNRRFVNYEGVQKWTRSVDIFSYDYIVVPINESAHWYVAVICNLPKLQRILKTSSEADNPPSNGSQEPASKPEGEVQAVPDTPVSSQEVAQGQGGSEEQKTNPEPVKEEAARQSMAAMTLHDNTETTGKPAQEIPASNEDWPEKAENPNTSPVRFISPPKTRSGARQTSEDAPKPTASSQKSKKSKKLRGPRNARDARDPLNPVIITFDSLNLARSPTIRNLRQYLSEEAQSKKGIDVDTTLVGGLRARSIPLQSNYSDCGLYLLAYVEKFVQDPDKFVSKLLRGKMDERTDWPPLSSGALRQRLRRFLDDLYDEQEQLSREELGEKRVMADMQPISFLLGEGELEPAKEEGKLDTDASQTKPSPQPEKASSQPEKASSQPEKTIEPFPLFLPPAEPENPPEEAPDTKASVTGPFQPLSISFSPGTPTRTGKHKGPHPSTAVRSVHGELAQHTEQGADRDVVVVPDSQEPELGILDLTSPQKKTGIQPPVPQPEKKYDNAVTVDDDNVSVKANISAPSNDGEKEKEVEVQISGTPPPSPAKETKSAKKKRKKLVAELGVL